jgi:rubrerythrin
MKENPICPNCGNAKIKFSKVRKIGSSESKDIPLKEYVEKQQAPQQYTVVFAGSDFVTYIQSVFQCEECGYTMTKEFAAPTWKIQ